MNILHQAHLAFEAFELWLREHPPDAVVGYSLQTMDCPVARWLREMTGDAITVSATLLRYSSGIPALLPPPFSTFIHLLDSCSEYSAPITAQVALEFVTLAKSAVALEAEEQRGVLHVVFSS